GASCWADRVLLKLSIPISAIQYGFAGAASSSSRRVPSDEPRKRLTAQTSTDGASVMPVVAPPFPKFKPAHVVSSRLLTSPLIPQTSGPPGPCAVFTAEAIASRRLYQSARSFSAMARFISLHGA